MLENLKDKKIILASQSPRRQELLKGLDIDFEIRVKPIDENYPSTLKPEEVPEFLAKLKASAFDGEIAEDEIFITSDTIVIRGNDILEKPKSKEDAIRMISQLSAASHTVITGVCIRSATKEMVFSDNTHVTFMPLTEEEISYYVEKYEPYDKAGAYGVQEWIGYVGIERLEGSYYNVMGLPLHLVYKALKSF
ncbi:Maf-like protein [Crocinitomix catalasitica]|uniref:Maf-like protein n=1 Tax=Crocinitomix catalasitica TaxID=184607 RepID=UPI0004883756|nr:Maf-like protein [Crocinitomix catalasitica]